MIRPMLAAWVALSLSLLTGCHAPGTTSSGPGALATTAPPIAAYAPTSATVAASHLQRDTDVRVMSFNLRVPFRLDGFNYWSHRKDRVIETIRSFQPDLLGTQECVVAQARYIEAAFPEYGFVGAGRDDGATGGEMAAIFYRRDRYRLLDSGHFWLSQTPDRVGSKGWDAMWRRVCTWARLESRADGRQLVFFNTHFDVNGDRARHQSALLLRQRIATIAGPLPVVVTGDFNCDEDSPPYRLLTQGDYAGQAPLQDAYREAHPVRRRGEGTRHGFSGRAGNKRIDWILTTHGFDTLAAGHDRRRMGGRYPSDHFPVLAVLAWNEEEMAARLAAHDVATVPARAAEGVRNPGS